MNVTRGRFITVEGIEGVGKTTNIRSLEALLRENGIDVVVTREPGGTPTAEAVRQILLAHGEDRIPPVAELLLFFAARAVNLENLIRPALDAGSWVICDRFTDATRAYQGAGRGQDSSRIEALANWVQHGLEPDLTLLFDAPVPLGLKRVARRGESDRMESERASFYERVRGKYLELAAAEPGRIRVIDASQELPAVERSVAAIVRPLISNAESS